MRTTPNIDGVMLLAVRSLARQRRLSMGTVVSELLRVALAQKKAVAERNGLPVLLAGDGASPVTMEQVNRLRDGYEACSRCCSSTSTSRLSTPHI